MAVSFVFLHGGGQGSWVWDETIAAIGRQAGDAVRCDALRWTARDAVPSAAATRQR
ncbi:hypothetical protein [Novosphingobium album (ex Hu et al. 2023)]|uniref:Alpha/beta hydrolase n=1 Tax=Novosphingobium album (ex Hu et al. 2023) TaxID=2930093 RepID=A0ABT0AZ74_9SPHN|nr:hypothetical protein [Novosphingobium album (ex Hu et al. 2023)]MCJ2178106.1 hypothetical protein [Novosphingobium album (ex Hu et al. 2023)]